MSNEHANMHLHIFFNYNMITVINQMAVKAMRKMKEFCRIQYAQVYNAHQKFRA